ncbi:MAG TPA: hypothetical protein VNR87_05440 [Flavisolibacter sp.]|nr:hypothetical protein [Flavisolibacter sp.]
MESQRQPTNGAKTGRHEHPLPNEIRESEKQQAANAHDAAEKDMEQDADLTAQSPNDDLDEGETARLGEDTTDLI